jgi:hypothetical protein
MRKVLFVAGEASGDLHAAGVAAALRRIRPELILAAVGVLAAPLRLLIGRLLLLRIGVVVVRLALFGQLCQLLAEGDALADKGDPSEAVVRYKQAFEKYISEISVYVHLSHFPAIATNGN